VILVQLGLKVKKEIQVQLVQLVQLEQLEQLGHKEQLDLLVQMGNQ
jgi:hypothetical protein